MTEGFAEEFLPRFMATKPAFHAGEPEAYLALWSERDPVTLFGARGLRVSGSAAVRTALREVSSEFSRLESYDWQLVACEADGALAYSLALEDYTASVRGAAPTRTQLRVTHLFRLEDEGWRSVHRHADRC